MRESDPKDHIDSLFAPRIRRSRLIAETIAGRSRIGDLKLAASGVTLGGLVGLVGAIVFGLHRGGQSESLLAFLGNVAGAGIGSAITVMFAVWIANGDRQRALKEERAKAISPVEALIDALQRLHFAEVNEIADAKVHLEVAVARIDRMLAQDHIEDVDVRALMTKARRIYGQQEAEIRRICDVALSQALIPRVAQGQPWTILNIAHSILELTNEFMAYRR